MPNVDKVHAIFSLLANGRKLLAWPGRFIVVVLVGVVNNFFSLFSSETIAPASLGRGLSIFLIACFSTVTLYFVDF